MKRFIIFIGMVLFCTTINAQTAGDALRYSYWEYNGSARYMATGGALGALGGDFTSMLNNPAGLATYRKSEITITPSITSNNIESNFGSLTNGSISTKNKFAINQVGLVFSSTNQEKDWKSINFGLGYNKLVDFNQRFNYSGNSQGSIANYFLDTAQGLEPSQLSDFSDGLAYDVDLIYLPDPNNPIFYENDLFEEDATQKFQNVITEGSLNQMNINLAANYKHRLYIGGGIGIAIARYNYSKTYEEQDPNNDILYFNNLEFRESLITEGGGFNFNIGAIYRVDQSFRIGLAIHSPTYLYLSDTFGNELSFNITYNEGTAQENTVTNSSQSAENGIFDYRQRTPARFIVNLGSVIKKTGFISAELEWLDYSNMKYNFNNEFANSATLQYQDAVNAQIVDIFQSAINLKVGGEVVIKKVFRLRAGYGLFGNPYYYNENFFDASQITTGIGIRRDKLFLDLAYAYFDRSENYSPYFSNEAPVINNITNKHKIVFTLGFKLGN